MSAGIETAHLDTMTAMPTPAPGRARGNNAHHPWVQPIVVAKTGRHEETLLCAAQASVGVYFEPSTAAYPPAHFDAWLDGPFTKTVRRASMTQMAGLVAWAAHHHIPYADAAVNDSAAIAFPPMRYEEMPREIAKYQVRGTDFPHAPLDFDDADAPVGIYVDRTLTTGKAAAAAAHATWAWMLDQRPANREVVESWAADGFPISLRLRDPDVLDYIATTAPYVGRIVDAGLTEVAPQTLTALWEPSPRG